MREGAGRRENGPPQDKRGRGQEDLPETLGPPQDKRGSGDSSDDDEEDSMDTSKPVGEKDTNETVTKKIKDNIDDDNLDLTSDIKPILSIGLTPPSNEVIEIELELC